MALIPATILTGFLGAGKTTLLNRILKEPHGLKIAVIENEFGPENIDNAILLENSNEEIVEMNNGCICCTVRGDLIAALGNLAAKQDRGEVQFDRIIIETTGMANPGPVAQTFFIDDDVAMRYRLDAVITVVDALHGMQQLDVQEEAQRQVGFADRLLLSKTDLVDAAAVDALRARLIRMNPRAPIAAVHFGSAPIDEILDIKGFNLNDKLIIDPSFLEQEAHEHAGHDHGHDHDHEHCDDPAHNHHHHRHHAHADDISAFSFTSERPFDAGKLDEFLSGLIQVYGPRMLRYKGVLLMDGADLKVVFQGVHQVMGTDITGPWAEGETPCTRMVFIGKNLPKETFIAGLEQCLV